MKCDELKSYYYYEDRVFTPATHTYRVYHADKVDAAIAELKKFAEDACLERDDSQTAIDELESENRKLRRALWLTRALRARDIQRWWITTTCAPVTEQACRVWNKVERKCLKKAEEYK